MEDTVKGNSGSIDIDLRDHRFSNRKPKTSAAGRHSDSVACLTTTVGLSSGEQLGSTVIEDMAV